MVPSLALSLDRWVYCFLPRPDLPNSLANQAGLARNNVFFHALQPFG